MFFFRVEEFIIGKSEDCFHSRKRTQCKQTHNHTRERSNETFLKFICSHAQIFCVNTLTRSPEIFFAVRAGTHKKTKFILDNQTSHGARIAKPSRVLTTEQSARPGSVPKRACALVVNFVSVLRLSGTKPLRQLATLSKPANPAGEGNPSCCSNAAIEHAQWRLFAREMGGTFNLGKARQISW